MFYRNWIWHLLYFIDIVIELNVIGVFSQKDKKHFWQTFKMTSFTWSYQWPRKSSFILFMGGHPLWWQPCLDHMTSWLLQTLIASYFASVFNSMLHFSSGALKYVSMHYLWPTIAHNHLHCVSVGVCDLFQFKNVLNLWTLNVTSRLSYNLQSIYFSLSMPGTLLLDMFG